MSDYLYGGTLAMIFVAFGLDMWRSRKPWASYAYIVGMLFAIAGIMIDPALTWADRMFVGGLLAGLTALCLGLALRFRKKERNHAEQEVHEGQGDGVAPEEAGGQPQ